MLDYNETMTCLKEMECHYKDGFTSSERHVIESLYNKICCKPIRTSGCSDCYRDAYIELVTTLKRLGNMPTTPNYVLKAGAVLHEFGSAEFYTLNNIPDDFAERWLASHPSDACLFEKMPSDWEERVNKRKNEAETKKTSDIEKENKENSNSENDVDSPLDFETETEPEKPRRGRPSNK